MTSVETKEWKEPDLSQPQFTAVRGPPKVARSVIWHYLALLEESQCHLALALSGQRSGGSYESQKLYVDQIRIHQGSAG
jgi:hypothetical protein